LEHSKRGINFYFDVTFIKLKTLIFASLLKSQEPQSTVKDDDRCEKKQIVGIIVPSGNEDAKPQVVNIEAKSKVVKQSSIQLKVNSKSNKEPNTLDTSTTQGKLIKLCL